MTPGRIAAALLLLALGCPPCVLAAQAGCRPGAWSQPHDLALPSGRLVYVEAPFPARFAGGLLLLGTPSFVWQSATVFADTGRIDPATYINADTLAGALIAPGRRVRLVGFPHGVTRMLAPRAVAHPSGWLDVFWGDSRDSANAAPLWVSDLWHARYDSAGWGPPDHVLSGTEVDWNNATPDVGLIGGVATVAVPVSRRVGRADTTGVAIVRRVAGGWSTALIRTESEPATYVALDTAADGSVVVAFTGALAVAGGPMVWNGAYVARSTDHGATWSRPTLLADGGVAHVFAMQSALTSDGALHLVWQQDSSASGGRRELVHAISTDGGVSWPSRRRLPLGQEVQVQLAAPLGDRVMLVVRREPARTLAFALLGAAGPDSLTPLDFPAAASLPRLAVLSAGRLLLVWGERRPHSYPAFPAFPAPVLLMSTFASRCDSVP